MNNCKIIELILVSTGSILIPIIFWYFKWNKEAKEVDRSIFVEKLGLNFEQLFEEEKYYNKKSNADNEKVFITETEQFNIPDILLICHYIIDFESKKNKFKRCGSNHSFKRLLTVCKQIEKLTSDPFWGFETMISSTVPISCYQRIYFENKALFSNVKDKYCKFYRCLFNVI